jgi:DNA-binding transcriptional ArsR family regulator
MGNGKCCGSADLIKGLRAKVPSDEDAGGQADFLKAISDPTRIKILYALTGGDLCVCELMALVNVPQTAVSHHCKVLKFAGIIADRKSGKWVNYSLVDRRAIEVLDAIRRSD